MVITTITQLPGVAEKCDVHNAIEWIKRDVVRGTLGRQVAPAAQRASGRR